MHVGMRASDGHGASGGDVAVAGGATLAGAAGIYGATTTSQTGPIIAGVVAIFVALVTWYATDRRQSKALAAERDRLDATFNHERALADVADVRLVAEAIMSSSNAVWFSSLELFGTDSDVEVVDRMKTAMLELQRALDALRVRLPRDDVLVVAAYELLSILEEARKSAASGDRAAFDEYDESHMVAYRAFMDAAVAVIGSRLPAATKH